MLYSDLHGFAALFPDNSPLRTAAAFLMEQAATLPDGRHDLGAGMHAEIRLYRPAPYAERPWECHQKYVDLHCVLEGSEAMHVAQTREMRVREDLLAERDVAFLDEPVTGTGDRFIMRPGFFILLFPEDAHKSECAIDCPQGRKSVVKLPVANLLAPSR